MKSERQQRFRSANRELDDFLERARALLHGTGDLNAADLQALSKLLQTLAPEIGEASLDATLSEIISEYKTNLQNVQAALEQVRGLMLVRRAQLDAAKRHMDAFQGWVSAYRQTA